MTFPRTAHALRSVLDEAGIRPRRRHGQHFLTDPQAVDAIVRDAGVTRGDKVVEVGTGVGLLTHALCEAGADVISFEVDGEILALARSLREWPLRVTFVEADVLARKHELAPVFHEALATRPPAPGRLLIVSNLPYGAGTPIVLDVLSMARPPDDMVVMLQEEVAEKLLARPGDRDYGAPSVVVGLKAEGEVLRRFGPEVFWPRPRVRSAVIRLTPRTVVPLEAAEHLPFGAFVTGLFSHRRKVLPGALRLTVKTVDGEAARRIVVGRELSPQSRVEQVDPETLLALWRDVRRHLEEAADA
ncbi:MAG: 16S rRNA (adenine(1518)-N(6)/adenine(1519)-N(6))-dimethyltransferase RsmA [Planctomycetota bacterium]|jgi:16S rRNA (adenine1518-N6/adenine1519-N6)-dimethyltransferase